MAKSVDPDEMAHEPSHLNLHRLQMYLYRSVGLEWLSNSPLAISADPDQSVASDQGLH